MMIQSLFEQHSEAVLAAIKDGASIPYAARGADIGAPTVSGGSPVAARIRRASTGRSPPASMLP
jgi:hypothetical protein